MAGIDSLIKGAVGSFAKDKAASFMTPSQMELARFAMNPQMYLADKGITAVAELLGYGNQYKELKTGAEDQKAYEKEVMRDSIGDMLPTAVGDFVRATPRGSEADQIPAGTYTAFDPETQTYIQQGSANPVGSSDPFASARFDAGINPNSQYNPASDAYMGAKPPSIQNEINLLDILDPYRAQAVPEMTIDGNQEGYRFNPNTGTSVPIDFGGTMEYSDDFGKYGLGVSGFGGKGFEREIESGGFDLFDGGGGKYTAYAKGGRIYISKR